MSRPVFSLQDHKVLVTGSARGLGESFVRSLHDAGAHVAISDVHIGQGFSRCGPNM